MVHLYNVDVFLMKACPMLSWLRSTNRLFSYVEFADNQSVTLPTHGLRHSDTLSICSPLFDIVFKMPVFGSGKMSARGYGRRNTVLVFLTFWWSADYAQHISIEAEDHYCTNYIHPVTL